MDKQQIRDLLALQMIPKVGHIAIKTLIAYCGSAEDVFKQKKHQLQKIPGIGVKIAENIHSFKNFEAADKELNFIEKNKIQVYNFLEKDYPQRLKDMPDAPILLFFKGNVNFNQARVLGIVGTRKATDYGKMLTEKLVEALAPYQVLIVSGLAYGIDYIAHKTAVKYNLPTVGVLGHGLNMLYPATHKPLAEKMLLNGGLLSEYPSGVPPDKEHFPERNRIVAGMLDGLVLVETAAKGGALITANIAHSYDREVFAFPGRTNDIYSQGCNHFIKQNKAYLIEGIDDIVYWLGWNNEEPKKDRQRNYENLSPMEEEIVRILKEKEKIDIDSLSFALNILPSTLSMTLLEMEFKGILQTLPGKVYRLI